MAVRVFEAEERMAQGEVDNHNVMEAVTTELKKKFNTTKRRVHILVCRNNSPMTIIKMWTVHRRLNTSWHFFRKIEEIVVTTTFICNNVVGNM